MRITTPITDMTVTIGGFAVRDGRLVMTSAATDGIQTTAVLSSRDIRRIMRAFVRPAVLLFILRCLLRRDDRPEAGAALHEHHPTPNPW